MWSVDKIVRLLYKLAVYIFACYLICLAVVTLAVYNDDLKKFGFHIFPQTRILANWIQRVIWDVKNVNLLWDKAAVLSHHASIVFVNHLKEITIVFITATVFPLQGMCLDATTVLST
jgi:hypothetical protein